LATNLQTSGDLDRAEALVKEVIETPALPISLESERQQIDRFTAAMVLFGIISEKREMEDNPLLKREAEETRDLVVSLLGGDAESPAVLQLDGHLAYADGKYSTAVGAYERALRLSATLPAEVLRKDADALERIGQQGTAVKRLEAAIDAEPRSIGNRLLLAALHGRMRNPQAALQTIESIPVQVRTENPDIARLEESLRLTLVGDRGRVEQAASGSDVVLQAIAKADQLDRDGQLTEALAVLQPLLDGAYSEDVRLLIAMGQIESKLGNRASALAFVQKAAELQPDNRQIEQMVLGLSSDDPIDVLRTVVEQEYPEGEARDVAWFVGLQGLARAQDERATTIESTDAEGAATARATAQRARDEAAPLADLIESAVSRNTQAFASHFEHLLSAGRFEEAEALLPAAREGNWDDAEGNLAETGLLMARGRARREAGADATDLFRQAAAAARRATDVAAWRAVTWQSLAHAQIEVGNFEEARAAFEEVIQRDPSDIKAIRQLSALNLQDGGDKTRAVALLADASKRFPQNRPLREIWLQIEAAHGDPAVALGERHRAWKKNPNDRQAALWYAGLMAVLPVDRAYVLDDEGVPTISGRAWLAMDSRNQDRAMEQLKQRWLDRIDRIADDLSSSRDRNLREAMQHATVLREAGRRDEMLSVLAAYLEGQRSADNLTQQVIQVAGFMTSADRVWEAQNLLESYRDAQNPEMLEIDSALGEMLHSIGSCNDALPYLTAVGNATGRVAIRLRAADCLLRMQRLDEASGLITALEAEEPDNYQIAMLTAGLHRGRGMVAEGAGNAPQAVAERAAFREALERASAIDPTRTAPFVELVESLVIEYRRTLDRRHLEEAMRYLEAASDLGQSAQLVLQRADVQEAMGDPRQAVLDLEAYLRKQPREKMVRRRLTDAYVTAGMPGRAIDSIEQAIGAEPRDPYWHGLLGDHLRQSGDDLERATLSYINAWRLEPTRRRLTALVDATRTDQPWDYEAALEAIEANAEHIANDPRIVGLRARAEAGLGLAARARESLREARAVYVAATASGAIPELFLENWYEDLFVLFPDGDVSEPVQLAAEIVGESPTRWDSRGLARFHALRGGDDLATAVQLQAAIVAEEDPELLPDDLRRLGAYQLAAGQDRDAADTFKRILDSTPDDAVALNNYAYLLATLLNDPATAEPLARRAVALRPREASFIDTMAAIQTQLGNHEAALSSMMAKLSLRPNDGPLLRSIASTLSEQLDRPQEAVPYAQQALSLDPRGVEALDLAGWVAWRAGQQAKGRDWVGQSIRRQPTAGAHLHMARILAAANEMGQARDHLQQAEHLAEDDSMREQIKAARSDLDGEG
jgi:tetratricopeptide (TPR) repeat protein